MAKSPQKRLNAKDEESRTYRIALSDTRRQPEVRAQNTVDFQNSCLTACQSLDNIQGRLWKTHLIEHQGQKANLTVVNHVVRHGKESLVPYVRQEFEDGIVQSDGPEISERFGEMVLGFGQQSNNDLGKVQRESACLHNPISNRS
ncbi:hypothetical protein WICPIJ_002068 [Wickerhamomyces pijperi]|uniref:Uncharacterized protein n=1 Tax=Wickerhamomyces pijperi TaxID=599730 RepID=A0A9P8QCD5_WICPI|nr:hypothetical protein WICPIJ_002068 [Wickerhamomyces pijperi]